MVIPASVTSSDGVVIPNPAATATDKATAIPVSIPASVTLPNESVVPNPALTATREPEEGGQTNTATDGPIRPTNVPEENSVISPGSNTLSDGIVVPVSQPSDQQTEQPTNLAGLAASSTLSNGDVIPVTAAPSLGSNRVGDSSQPAGPLSSTLPDGQVVPVASAGVSAPGTGEEPPAANTGESQASVTPAEAGVAQSQNNPAPTTGPVVTQPQVYPSDGKGPFTQKPTAYDDNTMQMVPSSILYYPSSLPTTATSGSYGPTGLPSDVPLILYPQSGPVNRPANTDLIQIGFKYPLNYEFVRTNAESQRQIFTFLPRGIAYGLGIDLENVTMQTLRAWDTTQDLHYITTLALAWIPSDLVDPLGLILRNPSEKFYNNPDPSIKTLVGMINNAIQIRANDESDGGSQTAGGTPESDDSSNSGEAPVGGNIGTSSPVKASSLGIGVGVVCGAAAYGAAMFFVARRYKKRRQSHMRSPSMFSSPVMSHAGPDPAAGAALMSGAMGGERSVSPYYDRTQSRGSGRSGASSGRQQISAPVMAENSLGWN